MLKADIARFFPSIYTHSIPWAIHGKTFAKRNRGPNHFGNALDECLRNIQDGQTIGIPVGQDISRVIAEAILARIEADLPVTKWPSGMRCIDDYELGFLDQTRASEFLNVLQKGLAEYELALNPLKTGIRPLPQLLMDRWDAQLRMFDFGPGFEGNVEDDDDDPSPLRALDTPDWMLPAASREKLLLFFNGAIHLQKEFPSEAVLRYSLVRVAHLKITGDCWALYQDYLFQCALNQPETLRLVISNLLKAVHLDGQKLDRRRFKTVLDSVIGDAVRVGHSSDVAWALWAAMLFDVRISRRAAAELESTEDSVIGCLASEAFTRGLLPKKFEPTALKALSAGSQSLYDETWLFAYEARRSGWFGCTSAGLDVCFSHLRASGVGFFVNDFADTTKKALQVAATSRKLPPAVEDSDESDGDSVFDNWWFDDAD